MVAASILPVSLHNGKLYFLFGKENSMEDSAKGWSDFGGRVDDGEKIYETACREGAEELTGFLGDANQLKKLIQKNGGTYKIVWYGQHGTKKTAYHVHIFVLNFDENLPKYYNQNHAFLWDKMDNKVLNDTKLFEKIEIGWFSVNDIVKRKKEFRGFYQNIVDLFLEDMTNIKKFISKKSKKSSTRKREK